MGIDVKALTKPSILTHRAGVRPVSVETRRRPSDAAEGTQAHENARRQTATSGVDAPPKSQSKFERVA